MKLITTKQTKLDKARVLGVVNHGLALSPAKEASIVLKRPDIPNMCPNAGVCARVCLKHTGMNIFPTHILARAKRTAFYHDDRAGFMRQLNVEIRKAAANAAQHGLAYAFRPDLLSDQRDMAKELANANPTIQFYDYTKLDDPAAHVLPNFHLTFSHSEKKTWAEHEAILQSGVNVAVVFDILKGQPFPATFRGWPVLDGTVSDLRYMDPTHHIVGLHFLGPRANLQAAIEGGFVLHAN